MLLLRKIRLWVLFLFFKGKVFEWMSFLKNVNILVLCENLLFEYLKICG